MTILGKVFRALFRAADAAPPRLDIMQTRALARETLVEQLEARERALFQQMPYEAGADDWRYRELINIRHELRQLRG